MHQACKYSSREIVGYLAQHASYFGIDIDADDPTGYTVLMKALFLKRDTDLAEELVAQGADVDKPNRQGLTIHAMAVMQGLKDIQMFAERHTKKTLIQQTLVEEAKQALYRSFDFKPMPGYSNPVLDSRTTLLPDSQTPTRPPVGQFRRLPLETKLHELNSTPLPDFSVIPNPFQTPTHRPAQPQQPPPRDDILISINQLLYENGLDQS